MHRTCAIGEAPFLQTEVGVRYVYDPEFAYRAFVIEGVDMRWRALRLNSSAWFATGDTNSGLRVLGGFRVVGPRPDIPAQDGSFVDFETALTHRRFTSDGFRTTTGEVSLAARLDLARLGSSLDGSFAEGALGTALENHAYDVARSSDVDALLLFRTAYGIYLGRQGGPRGEVKIFYDHRHDDFAAGLKLPGLVSGVFGHVGFAGVGYLNSGWGLAVDAERGSAYVVGLSLLRRLGGTCAARMCSKSGAGP